ncbi:MAG: hypothetical protein C0483_14340 [Pirellula sp.]|nr:hypothetical protein [Pirellula sp.]
MRTKFAFTIVLLALVCGCEPPAAKTRGAAPNPEQTPPAAVPQFAPRVAAGGPVPPATNSTPVTNNIPDHITTTKTAAPGMVREEANSALTAKGKYSVDIVTTPVTAYFTVKDQVVFKFQIPKALEYYELANGRKPRTYEEFNREVIEKNRIQLPELPPLHRYFYDPETGSLLVEHPTSEMPKPSNPQLFD